MKFIWNIIEFYKKYDIELLDYAINYYNAKNEQLQIPSLELLEEFKNDYKKKLEITM